MSRAEERDYVQYCTPAILHKATNELYGLLNGIKIDGAVGRTEIDELVYWCTLFSEYRHRHPFSELFSVIENAFSDNVLTTDEIADILWVCERFQPANQYYDDITSANQYMMGMLHGIMADGRIDNSEIVSLLKSMGDIDFLKGTYPYDEIDSLLTAIMGDKIITEEERLHFTAFVSDFIDSSRSLHIHQPDMDLLRSKYSVTGICAVDPEIILNGRSFCFTGESRRAKRAEIQDVITSNGGIAHENVRNDTKYLIIGDAGNQCWAYSCYGRKVEKAVQMRKEGRPIIIAHEVDFWDALA